MIIGAETDQLFRNAEKLKALFSVLEGTMHELYSAANRLSGSNVVEREAEYLKRLSRASAQEMDALQALQRALLAAAEAYEDAERRNSFRQETSLYGDRATVGISAANENIYADAARIGTQTLHETYQNLIYPLIYTTEGREKP